MLDFDGKKFRRYNHRFYIAEYNGVKSIESLPCYPLEFHEDPAKMKKILRERGTKFRDCYTRKKGEQMFNYDGEVLCANTTGRNFGFGDAGFERFFLSLATIGATMANREVDGNSRERVRYSP